MDVKLAQFIKSLGSLKDTLGNATISDGGFQTHGWNQVHLSQNHIGYILNNYIEKLESYGDQNITEGLGNSIDEHNEKIGLLNTASKTYFTNNAAHLIHFVPVILLTLQAIFSDIDYELFSYENVQDKKLLPKGLALRLRSVSTRLSSIDESSVGLEKKIEVINEAHEAAESLPTDLASLKEAKEELTNLLTIARSEYEAAKKDFVSLKEETVVLKNEAKKVNEEIASFEAQAAASADAAAKLVNECDDALQITTTQGLAAGFDQKANQLKNSMWVWIVGLLIALGAGAWVGAERVKYFTQALTSDLTAGQAILHSIMSVFSIGGPLWLAWISTQQINQRFKLSEDYSYKATVAKAFTGFKKFAERFDSSTEERLFNSTLDRLDEMPLRLIDGKDYNSPWHEFVDSESFKKAISAIPELAREAGKFANKTDLKKKPKPQKLDVKPEPKQQASEDQTAAE